jgi:enamine deaminase RidA (YjgF/YER057c/UK114 family)
MASGETSDTEETQTPDMIEPADPVQAPPPSGPGPARRPTKFMAELSHAMQAAAEHARNETMERFQAEAKTVVEEIHANATSEVAELRTKADEDVAAIREWSKAEIARVREETEARIGARKTGLESEMAAHAAAVDARAERVTAVVTAFETEMASFFARLSGEEDPTRIATMAETMPDPPSLEEVVASIVSGGSLGSAFPAGLPAAASDDPTWTDQSQPTVPEAGPETAAAGPAAEIDFAAAEAEALSFTDDLAGLGDDDDGASAEPAGDAIEAASGETLTELEAVIGTPDTLVSTRVVVAGLISVASIANFKRSLGRIGGVSSIGVSSGPNGEFVFAVAHHAGLALASEIVSMPTFESQLIGGSDGEIQVSSRDRDTID